MIEFARVVDTLHPHWQFLTVCYREAFPPDERRSVEQLEVLLQKDMFQCNVLLLELMPVGLMNTWQLGGFRYIEHFAMDVAVRGHGLGETALYAYLRQSTLPVVLEVEPPVDEIKCRRVRFYEKAGFLLCPEPFVQPPYSPAKNPVELRLMEWGGKLLNEDVVKIKNELYHTVYTVDDIYTKKG